MRLRKKLIVLSSLIGVVFILFYLYFWLIDYKTTISVTGGENPTFKFSGSGRLIDFALIGPRQRPGNGRNSFTIWELKPTSDSAEGEFVGILGPIEYGIVPKGYMQVYPDHDASPPPLRSGEKYLVQAITNNAPWGQIQFEIREGKAIETQVK